MVDTETENEVGERDLPSKWEGNPTCGGCHIEIIIEVFESDL